ncbi:MAG: HAD family hydrolase [Rhodobacteraceae bacterium]|nr:MAG: HAD family hydrolase [Paracoccaceae bacterium]
MTLPDTTFPRADPVPTLSVEAAFARYEAIRARLPQARTPGAAPRHVGGLLELADRFDGFLFDSFGVLNVGDTAIPGAADCLVQLRQRGKRIRILTNAASYTGEAALAKYRRLGLEVRREEIVSSRDVTFAHLGAVAGDPLWGAISAEGDRFEDAGRHRLFDLLGSEAAWDRAEGFLFLSSARWTAALQDRLVATLTASPRPVVIANPDLVAPREGGLTVEPGYWAHDLQDRTGIVPRLFGKPYANAFDIALTGLGPGRYAMIGDTLHTDILGGQASGLQTILVIRHGIFAGHPVETYLAASGVAPDFILPAI